jgi:hypothetical protein
MTTDERDWHERMADRLRGDVVNLAVAAQAFDRYGDSRMANATRVLILDLQARALIHEELVAKGGDAVTPMA